MKTIHNIQVKTNAGNDVSLGEYKDQVLLIVNTASECGFTPQYADLESLYKEYKDKGFSVLAFPCNQFGAQEKGSDEEIKDFCDLQFNISFPIFSKIDVNGDNTHELYQHLKKEAPGLLGSEKIKWNFTKFLVGRNGEVIKRFAPATKIKDIEPEVKNLLA